MTLWQPLVYWDWWLPGLYGKQVVSSIQTTGNRFNLLVPKAFLSRFLVQCFKHICNQFHIAVASNLLQTTAMQLVREYMLFFSNEWLPWGHWLILGNSNWFHSNYQQPLTIGWGKFIFPYWIDLMLIGWTVGLNNTTTCLSRNLH